MCVQQTEPFLLPIHSFTSSFRTTLAEWRIKVFVQTKEERKKKGRLSFGALSTSNNVHKIPPPEKSKEERQKEKLQVEMYSKKEDLVGQKWPQLFVFSQEEEENLVCASLPFPPLLRSRKKGSSWVCYTVPLGSGCFSVV